ncbi:MAG TPA: hypothetical protein EYH01_00200 [Campylobacterales bacterium]|nr:hypothetical protein [Campylobacterales bacterium]
MSTFTNSITNIVNSGYINTNYTSKQISQIAESIKNGAIDTVTFSDESKSLFQISQIDSTLNGIFGVPNDLDSKQQKELESLRANLDTIYPTNSSQLQLINFDEIFQNLGVSEGSKEQIQSLTNELSQYLTQRSIIELFGDSGETNLSFFSEGYNKILGEKLTESETNGLGTLSIQLNRLLFNSDDNQLSSYLNLFNDLYGLNSPSDEELFSANSLLTQRNTLLSTALIERSYQSSYTL